MNKRVLITGACGFIGRHVARQYAEAGWSVTGIGFGAWPEEEWRRWGLSAWHESAVTLDALRDCACVPDVVVHCAGGSSVGLSVSEPYQDFLHTVGTTAALLEYVRLHAPQARVVYPSSAGVYGAAQKIPIAEDDALRPVSPYGTHKLMAEQLCAGYAGNFGVRIAIVRLFSVYGAGLRKQLLWDACTRLARSEHEFFGSGLEMRDWLHVSDAAGLLMAAGTHASTDCPIVNGGSGQGASVREVLTELYSACGSRDAPGFSGAARAGDPANYVADIARARAWGWQPQVAWRDGVREYAQWFRSGAP